VFLEEYGEFAYGDMHQFNGVYVLRSSGQGPKPMNGMAEVHFKVAQTLAIWDGKPYGAIFCAGVTYFGYDGAPISEVLPQWQEVSATKSEDACE